MREVFDSVEVKHTQDILNPKDLVENLIEIACDKKLLGRLWTGWMAHV